MMDNDFLGTSIRITLLRTLRIVNHDKKKLKYNIGNVWQSGKKSSGVCFNARNAARKSFILLDWLS